MNAILRRLVVLGALVAVCGSATAQDPSGSSASEQNDQEEERLRDVGYGQMLFEVTAWIAQPTGTEYNAATRLDPLDEFGTTVIDVGQGTENSFIWKGAFIFAKNIGEFSISWWAHETEADLQILRPGDFQFGEINVNPLFAGVNDDGKSDGFIADTSTSIDDLKIAWGRQAFKNKRITGSWYVMARRVEHDRRMSVNYYALAPNLPPVIPPLSSARPDLVPNFDRAVMSSGYEGRGLGAGLDVVLLISRRKLFMEAGLGVTVLRGKVTTRFTSQTHYYATIVSGAIDEILAPPYSEFEDPNLIDDIGQFESGVGVNADSISQNASVLEAYLGFRWLAWKGLEVTLGFRTQQYLDVGADYAARSVTTGPNDAINVQSLQQTSRSVSYEGLYVGLGYRF